MNSCWQVHVGQSIWRCESLNQARALLKAWQYKLLYGSGSKGIYSRDDGERATLTFA